MGMRASSKHQSLESGEVYNLARTMLRDGYYHLLASNISVLARGDFALLMQGDGRLFKDLLDLNNPDALRTVFHNLKSDKAFLIISRDKCDLLRYLLDRISGGKMEPSVAVQSLTILTSPKAILHDEVACYIQNLSEVAKEKVEEIYSQVPKPQPYHAL